MSPGHESDILQGREAGIKTWLFLCPPLIMDVLTEKRAALAQEGGECWKFFTVLSISVTKK